MAKAARARRCQSLSDSSASARDINSGMSTCSVAASALKLLRSKHASLPKGSGHHGICLDLYSRSLVKSGHIFWPSTRR